MNKKKMFCKKFVCILFFIFSLTISSCFEKEDLEIFERQVDETSLDLMQIGDDLSYFGHDVPKGGIFIINSKANFLKAFGIKLAKFEEMDKTISQLEKLISTEPIYQIEVYELPHSENITIKDPKICEIITENFHNAKLIYKAKNLSFRVRERDWIELNLKINPNKFTFVRLAIGDYFSTIQNKAVDAIFIKAKKNIKEPNLYINKDKIISWACQEFTFINEKTFEPAFYNPDIVFYLSK